MKVSSSFYYLEQSVLNYEKMQEKLAYRALIYSVSQLNWH